MIGSGILGGNDIVKFIRDRTVDHEKDLKIIIAPLSRLLEGLRMDEDVALQARDAQDEGHDAAPLRVVAGDGIQLEVDVCPDVDNFNKYIEFQFGS